MYGVVFHEFYFYVMSTLALGIPSGSWFAVILLFPLTNHWDIR